jgi:hypothetical protein
MNNYRNKLIKHAYLIGAPGGPENGTDFLHGVSNDPLNMKRFLKSRNGGAWRENEITILSFAHYTAIKDRLDFTYEDFRLTYFSGHGFIDQASGNNCLLFQDGWVYDTDLINPYILKQSIICDSCRNFVDLGKISGIEKEQEEWRNASGDDIVRELFDKWIMESPNGIQIFHAVASGLIAWDTSSGGLFTNRLIQAAQIEMQQFDDYSYSTLLQFVEYLRHPGISQNKQQRMPSFTYAEGNLKVPFAVGFPATKETFIPKAAYNFQFQEAKPTFNWPAIGFAAFCMTAAIALSNK